MITNDTNDNGDDEDDDDWNYDNDNDDDEDDEDVTKMTFCYRMLSQATFGGNVLEIHRKISVSRH